MGKTTKNSIFVAVRPIKELSIFAGPKASILLDEEIGFFIDGDKIPPENEDDVSLPISSTDISFSLGMVFHHDSDATISVGYEIGQIDLIKNIDEEAFNRVFHLSLGYTYD